MVMAGFALRVVSYFYLAAPLGNPTSEVFSYLGMPNAPLFSILGVMLVFLAAVVYELLPDKVNR